MKRRLTVLLCLVLSLLLLTGCASQTISKAKTAYANGDYQAVVDLLEGMKNPKPEAVELLNNAKIHLAFDAEDYQKVLDLAGDAEIKDEAIAALVEQARTAVEDARAAEEAKAALEAKIAEIKDAFAAGDFQKVVDLAGDEEFEDEVGTAAVKDAKAALEEAAAKAAKAAEIKEAFEA